MASGIGTVTSKGQVTVPEEIRERRKIRTGTKLLFLEDGEDLRVITMEQLGEMFCSIHKATEELGITRESIRPSLAAAREETMRRWRDAASSR